MGTPRDGYALAEVQKRKWGSMTGLLPEDRLQFLSERIAPGPVLEVGCGGGWYSQHFGKSHEASACDLHEDFLTVPPAERRFLFKQADASSLPFEDKAFETTFSLDVLEHVEDDVAALREMARVTRGRILLSIPRKADEVKDYRLAFHTYFDPTHLRYYDEDSIRALCAKAGLGEPEIFPGTPVYLNQLCADHALSDEFPAKMPWELLPYLWLGALKEGIKALPKEGVLHPRTWHRRNLRRLFGSTFNRFRPIHTEYRVSVGATR